MKPLITKLSFILCLSITVPFQAQLHQQNDEEVPEENHTLQTQVYGELNVATIREKINIEQLTQSIFVDKLQHHELDHFFNKMLPGIDVDIKKLDELGLSTKEDLTFSFQTFDMGSLRMSFQLTIADKALLLSKIQQIIASNDRYKAYYESADKSSHTFIIRDSYSRVKLTNLTLNQDKLLFSVAIVEKPYEEVEEAATYEYVAPIEEPTEEGVVVEPSEEEEEAEEESVEENYQEIVDAFVPLFQQLLASNNGKAALPKYVSEEIDGKKQDDLYFWLDYAVFQEVYYNGIYREMRSLPRAFRDFLIQSMAYNSQGASYLLGVSFEEGEIASTLTSYFNERMKKTMKRYMKSSFERSMLKYLSKNYLFCAGYSIRPQPIAEIMKEQYYPLLDSLYPDYAPTVKGVVELVDLILDEKALHKFAEGDIIFSFDGMQEIEMEVEERVYDDNYEYTYETVIRKRKIPNLTLMLSTKDEERWEKVIRMGLAAKPYFQAMEGYYVLHMGYDGNIYFAVKKGVVLATTNKELVSVYLNDGYPKAMALSKEDMKTFKKNNLVALGHPMKETPDDRELREFKEFTDKVKLESMDMKGGKVKGNSMTVTSSISFDTEENSFDHVIKMLDLFMK